MSLRSPQGYWRTEEEKALLRSHYQEVLLDPPVATVRLLGVCYFGARHSMLRCWPLVKKVGGLSVFVLKEGGQGGKQREGSCSMGTVERFLFHLGQDVAGCSSASQNIARNPWLSQSYRGR